jgi:hypothetical protein
MRVRDEVSESSIKNWPCQLRNVNCGLGETFMIDCRFTRYGVACVEGRWTHLLLKAR